MGMNLIKSISASVLSTLLLALGQERLAARLDPLAAIPNANRGGELRSTGFSGIHCNLIRS